MTSVCKEEIQAIGHSLDLSARPVKQARRRQRAHLKHVLVVLVFQNQLFEIVEGALVGHLLAGLEQRVSGGAVLTGSTCTHECHVSWPVSTR